MSALEPGAALGPVSYVVRRVDLVRYAGASGDFNPIHWSERVATEVGLPSVIAHGMYTLALAGRAVSDWAGGADRVVELGGRFTKPVVVPDDETGVVVEVTGEVKATDRPDRVRIDLTVTCSGQKVLGMARAVVAADG
jgi:acyl dehydratase